MGRDSSKTSIGSNGHTGGTRPDQMCKTPKDLSAREREECVCGQGVGLYVVYIRERGGGGRRESGIRSAISGVIHMMWVHSFFLFLL